MSKSTTYSLESPKDPVLPARFFTQPDKVVTVGLLVGVEMKCVLSTGLWGDKGGPLLRTPHYQCLERALDSEM